LSKPILHEIDRVLAAHYRFTDEELDLVPSTQLRAGPSTKLRAGNHDITGAKCQLVVTEDTITVMSPGAPLPPITMEQLQSFTAPMLSRNPALHYVFARMRMAEERGLGIKSLKAAAEGQGLPLTEICLGCALSETYTLSKQGWRGADA
jgi:ATP-dependent DNA helicase RecG